MSTGPSPSPGSVKELQVHVFKLSQDLGRLTETAKGLCKEVRILKCARNIEWYYRAQLELHMDHIQKGFSSLNVNLKLSPLDTLTCECGSHGATTGVPSTRSEFPEESKPRYPPTAYPPGLIRTSGNPPPDPIDVWTVMNRDPLPGTTLPPYSSTKNLAVAISLLGNDKDILHQALMGRNHPLPK